MYGTTARISRSLIHSIQYLYRRVLAYGRDIGHGAQWLAHAFWQPFEDVAPKIHRLALASKGMSRRAIRRTKTISRDALYILGFSLGLSLDVRLIIGSAGLETRLKCFEARQSDKDISRIDSESAFVCLTPCIQIFSTTIKPLLARSSMVRLLVP